VIDGSKDTVIATYEFNAGLEPEGVADAGLGLNPPDGLGGIARHGHRTPAQIRKTGAAVARKLEEGTLANTLRCTDTSSPYTCVWSVPNAKNAQYTLSAKAYDANGNTGINSSIVTARS
jgi:hypothetical protein